MSDPIIKAENIKVIYNHREANEVRSLDDVSLEIFPREYVIVHGPSGCGKSTLLYSIAGLQQLTGGKITVAGKNVSEMKKTEKLKLHQDVVGMIFQAFYLIESLNVIDNICLPMTFKGSSHGKRKEEAMKLLRRFGISEQAYKFPNQLSGGQKQKVAIARALINNPEIILADEPVGNLDSESSFTVMKIIKELNEVDKKTVILVTHNIEQLHYGDRIITMRDGKIISEEINKEKRPPEAVERVTELFTERISPELKILMRAFKNLNPQQIGALLIPYRSKQLLYHILFGYTEEQVNLADGLLKEFLFKNISVEDMEKGLDNRIDKGGAGWDKRKADHFSKRVKEIISHAELLKQEEGKTAELLAEYMTKLFELNVDISLKNRFYSILEDRIKNKTDCFVLKKKLDDPRILGGMGFNSATADKIVREIEIVMLLSYSP